MRVTIKMIDGTEYLYHDDEDNVSSMLDQYAACGMPSVHTIEQNGKRRLVLNAQYIMAIEAKGEE